MKNLTTGKRIAIAALAAVGALAAGAFCFWIGGGNMFTPYAGAVAVTSILLSVVASKIAWLYTE